MSRALVILDSDFQRRRAAEWCWALKDGTRCEFKGPKRTLDQNSLFWALLTDVATQLKWHGLKLTPDDWKLMFLDALRREKKGELRVVPNTDDSGFVNLATSSSDLSKEEMSELIELILAFGANHGVTFNNTPAADNDAGTAEPVASPSGSATSSLAMDLSASEASPTVEPQAPRTPAVGEVANSEGEVDAGNNVGAPSDSGSARTSSPDAAAPIPGHSEPRGEATASDGSQVPPDAQSAPAAAPEASTALSDEDRSWLIIGARMLLACQPDKSPEARMVLRAQAEAILTTTSKTVGKEARKRLDAIHKHCVSVCRGEVEIDVQLIASTALTTVEAVTPKQPKMRSA